MEKPSVLRLWCGVSLGDVGDGLLERWVAGAGGHGREYIAP